MAYNDFSLEALIEQFGLQTDEQGIRPARIGEGQPPAGGLDASCSMASRMATTFPAWLM